MLARCHQFGKEAMLCIKSQDNTVSTSEFKCSAMEVLRAQVVIVSDVIDRRCMQQDLEAPSVGISLG